MKRRNHLTVFFVAGFVVAALLTSVSPVASGHTLAKSNNKLLFRTPGEGVSIGVGQSKSLGTIDVTSYNKIRVVVNEKAGSSTDADVQFIMFENTEKIGVLDVVHAKPNISSTRLYDIPGTKLEISSTALSQGSGTATVTVFVYGSE